MTCLIPTSLLALGDIVMTHSDLLGLRRINSSPILLLDEDISRNASLSAASSPCWAPIITIRRSSPRLLDNNGARCRFPRKCPASGRNREWFCNCCGFRPSRPHRVRKSTSRSPLIRERAFGLGCRRAIREKGDTRSIQTYKRSRGYRTCGL